MLHPSETVKKRVSTIPERPGVYLLKDKHKKIIYIGKAKNLKNRLKTHLIGSPSEHPRLRSLWSKISNFDYIPTDTEMEALILEANLIKMHLPRYNVRLKDDKKYPYIKVTVNEDFPKVFPTRNLKKDGSILFGPYTNVKTMKRALRTVKKIFPVRNCKQTIPSAKRPCLNFYIKRCYGPCQGYISKEEYRSMIEEVCKFLSGKNRTVENELSKSMESTSNELRFEEAARIRDQLLAVREVVRRQRVVFKDELDRDILGLARIKNTSCVVLLQIRDGKLTGQEHYILTQTKYTDDAEVVATFIKQYYKSAYFIPNEIVIPTKIEDTPLIARWLSDKKGHKVKLILLKRGEKLKLVDFARRNGLVILEEKEMKDKARLPFPIKELQKVLSLEKPPITIDAFDISDLFGKDACGSLVVFEFGRPKKSNYKRFKIKTVESIDDYAMIQEVVGRRYRRMIKEKKSMPDLILIDGGIGQVNVAKRVLQDTGIRTVPVYGLAKRLDELVLPDGKTLMLPPSSYALRLLQRIRDEAHRFALSYHRILRSKRLKKSIMDEIPGIGKSKKIALIRYFGSIQKIKEASVEELEKVDGVGKYLAERVYTSLHNTYT